MPKAKENPAPEYKQVQFYFSTEALTALDEFKEAIRARTRSDVIRRALELYAMVMEAKMAGGKLGFQDKDGNMNWFVLPQ